MKILYFDCAAGISGEMAIGALLDLGCDIHFLARELSHLTFGTEYEINVYKTQKHGISASCFYINTSDVPDIRISAEKLLKAVSESGLSSEVKKITMSAFLRILKAKSVVYDNPYDEIFLSFKETVKCVVSIAACAILINFLAHDSIVFSPISEGSGFVNISGSVFSIPEPVVSEILRDAKAKINSTSVPRELITADGAAISAELSERFASLPPIIIKAVGYGAADFDLDDRPAVLRVISGETQSKLSLDIQTDFSVETSGLFFENFGYNMSINTKQEKRCDKK